MPRPWRRVAIPHPDVAGGRWARAAFAADLAQVVAGCAPPAYQDPVEFFGRTHLTAGLRRLLAAALARLGGRGGEPVVRLRTPFGGGKTHAMLALYHQFGGTGQSAALPGTAALLAEAQVEGPPPARLAVLVGSDLGPAAPWPCRALAGRPVRTLWGEMAAQLGGAAAYEAVRRADEAGTPPGAGELLRLLDGRGPALVLVDELIAFARTLYGRSDLPAGSFDANLTFVHNLTEAVRRSSTALLVLTLPASPVEVGGRAGQAALERIEATVGRVETIWRPLAADERLEVVRRRLFQPLTEPAAADAACRAFGRMYAGAASAFPPEAREDPYLRRLRAAYPIHPELFDRLDGDWARTGPLPGARGVLRLMAAAVHELWQRQDDAWLILPGALPLDAPRVREELTRHLGEDWSALVDVDVDGARAEPLVIEREDPRLGRVGAARRLARAIFLGSVPAPDRQARGIEDARIRLGVVQPGEPVALFDDALSRLRERLAYLHGDGRRLWYDTRPNLNRLVADRADRLPAWRIEEEVRRRLRPLEPGGFAAVHVHRPGAEIPDVPEARLVVLPHGDAHRDGGGDGDGTTPALRRAEAILQWRGTARRRFRNMLIFLAADSGATESLTAAVGRHLAWQSVLEDAEAGLLALDPFQRQAAVAAAGTNDAALRQRLQDAYRWLLVPTQSGTAPVRWETLHIPGSDPYVARATRRLARDELLIARWSPALLRRELDRWLWTDGAHATLRQVWEALASYCYLPRLRDVGVLLAAVAEGVRPPAYFGYADAVGADGSYLGLRLGEPVPEARADAAAVLVRAEAAATQIHGTHPTGGGDGGREDGGAEGGADGEAPAGVGAGADASGEGSGARRVVRRFHGSVALDPDRAERDLGRVVAEVLQHLRGLGATIDVQLDITAACADGLPPEILRILQENCRTLKFRTSRFDER